MCVCVCVRVCVRACVCVRLCLTMYSTLTEQLQDTPKGTTIVDNKVLAAVDIAAVDITASSHRDSPPTLFLYLLLRK